MDCKFTLAVPYQACAKVLRIKAVKSQGEGKHDKVVYFVACPVENCTEVFKHVTSLVLHRAEAHASIEEQETLYQMRKNRKSILQIKCYYCHRKYTQKGLYFKNLRYHAEKILTSEVWPFEDLSLD